MRRAAVAAVVLAALAAAPPAAAAPADVVRQVVRNAGFGDVLAARAAAVALPTIRIFRHLRDRPPRQRGTSRLGGPPDLPAGVRWPRCHGRPQTFLGQIHVLDLPRSAWQLRRVGGLLLFFTDIRTQRNALPPGQQDAAAVAGRCTRAVHAAPGARLRRTSPPAGARKLRPATLDFRTRPDMPDYAPFSEHLYPPLTDVHLPFKTGQRWALRRFRLLWPSQARHHGIQHRMLGYLTVPTEESGRCWRHAVDRSRPWRHLFTIGPDSGLGFDIGLASALQIVIGPGDLRRGRFGRVCGIFDSV
jgi:uncharacterized protein DUF1963